MSVHLSINRAPGLRQIKKELRNFLREQHTLALGTMEELADKIYAESFSLVPVASGELQRSIQVEVSRSPRYPGIIATAEAHNPTTGYDYALIQEVNDSYEHPNGGQAHFLEEPYRKAVEEFFTRMGWK